MSYRVHRLDIKLENEEYKLEQFLNTLEGDIISIIPHIKPAMHPMGATAKIDYLLIVEKQIIQ
jgi:hypothetical protein